MPTEILSTIINLAGPTNFPALRLTNKRLCAVSNEPIGIKHFSERRHVQSAHSMDTLIAIIAHPYFGKFVRTVIVSAYRRGPHVTQSNYKDYCWWCGRPKQWCHNSAPRHQPLRLEPLVEKLEEVFSYVKRYSPTVSIGVSDNIINCYGTKSEADPRSLYKIFGGFEWQERCYVTRTFEIVRMAVQKSGCIIEGVKLDRFGMRPRNRHCPR